MKNNLLKIFLGITTIFGIQNQIKAGTIDGNLYGAYNKEIFVI